MNTSQNIALRSAQFIRNAVKDLRQFTEPVAHARPESRESRTNALATLEEVGTQLEQHAAGFECSAAVDETRWLIGYAVGGPKWVARFESRDTTFGGGVWRQSHFRRLAPVETENANEAMAFCRERDAQAMLESIDHPYRGILRVEEHMWDGVSPPLAPTGASR